MSLERELAWVRLAAERAALRRLNAGFGFAASRPLVETYFQEDALRERLGRDLLRPADTHLEQQRAVEEELASLGEASESPLTTLGARLGLGSLEQRVLRVAVAHALDPDVRALCLGLSGLTRPILTVAIIADVLRGTDDTDGLGILSVLHSNGSLCRHRSISLGGGAGLGAQVSIGPDLLAALRSDARVPSRFSRLIPPAPPGELLLLDSTSRERISEVVSLCGNGPAPAIIIAGVQGSGKRAIARAVATELDRHILAVDGAALTENDDLGDVLAFARLHDRLLYIAGVETIEDPSAIRSIDEHDDLVLLATRETGISTLRLTRPAHRILAPQPSLEVRTQAWREALAASGDIADADAETLAARYVIGVGAIADVLGDAERFARASGTPLVCDHLEDAISRRLSLNLGVLGQRITRRASFEEMVLPEDVHDTLRDLIAMVRGRSQILESWGYERHLGLSRGVSALFSGAPGTGKTMAASVVSSELGLELFRIDLSSVVSKWVGETEKNLARIFDEAQDAHAMLLFDEADSLFGKRTDVQNASDRYANLEVNYVLQRMEQFDGISVLTTNLESGIDAAFMRRLNFRVRFPEPEEEERAQLWRKLLPPESGLANIDVTELAERFEMTGGHIRNAIVRAAVVASRDGRAMEKDDLLRGAHHEYYELGKVMHSSL